MKTKSAPTSSNSKDGNEGYSKADEVKQTEISLYIDKLTIACHMPAQLTEGMVPFVYDCLKDKELSAPQGLFRAFGTQVRGYKVNVGVRGPCATNATGWSDKTGCLVQIGPANPA